MSIKHGAYLGGVRTIEDMRLRCRMNEETGCWHWGMAINQGFPEVHFVLDGKRQKTKGRRAALILAGKKIHKGHVAFALAICPSADCVNPEHCRSGDRHAAGAALAASGKTKNLPSKIKASRDMWAKRRKITPEIAAEIRASSESNAKLAGRLGVSNFAVWACKVGKSHNKPIGASAFSWRP